MSVDVDHHTATQTVLVSRHIREPMDIVQDARRGDEGCLSTVHEVMKNGPPNDASLKSPDRK